MKNKLYLLFALCLLFSANMYAGKRVSIKGEWGKERIRTLLPAPPAVYIDNNVLSIYLADPLTDLEVVVTDSDGAIVYQGSISATYPGYTFTIDLPDDSQDGEYTITLSHSLYGHLEGRL